MSSTFTAASFISAYISAVIPGIGTSSLLAASSVASASLNPIASYTLSSSTSCVARPSSAGFSSIVRVLQSTTATSYSEGREREL
jgi:hypothetical protein